MNSDFCQGGGGITSFLNSPHRYARSEEDFVAFMTEQGWHIGEGVFTSSDDYDPPRRYVRTAYGKPERNWDRDLWEYEAVVNYPALLKPLYDRLKDNDSPAPVNEGGQSLIAQVMMVLMSRVPNHCPGATDCFDVVNQKYNGSAPWDGAVGLPVIGSLYGWWRILVLDEKPDTWRNAAGGRAVIPGISGMLKQVGADHRGRVFVNTDDDAIAMNYVTVTNPVKCRHRDGIALVKCAKTMLSPELDILRPRIVIYRGSAEKAAIIGNALDKGFGMNRREPGLYAGLLTYSIKEPQVHPFVRPNTAAKADFCLFDTNETGGACCG